MSPKSKMTREAITDLLDDEQTVVFLDPPKTFDQAIIGLGEYWAPTKGGGSERVVAVVYDSQLCIEGLMEDGMDYEDATEFFDFNTAGAYMGKNTPIFVEIPQEPEGFSIQEAP